MPCRFCFYQAFSGKSIIKTQSRPASERNFPGADLNPDGHSPDFPGEHMRLAYSAGADVKIVSQNLGHASTSVTLDTYTHLTEDKKKEQEAVAQTVRIS